MSVADGERRPTGTALAQRANAHRGVHVPRDLQVHPERGVVAEVQREAHRGVRRDRAAAVDELVDAAAGNAERAARARSG